MKLLLTSTSFQDTPGAHQERLAQTDFEVDLLRGPLKEEVLLPIIGNYDAVICGDDEFTAQVIQAGVSGKLKFISKYGIGLDKIDLSAARDAGIPVTNCPGVNHITVAEHVLALLLTFYKNIHLEYNVTRTGGWKRHIGHEIFGKAIGILGFGKIGREVAQRCTAMGMKVSAYDVEMDEEYARNIQVDVKDSVEVLVKDIDILSLHLPLTDRSRGLINADLLELSSRKLVLVNTSRALIVHQESLLQALTEKKLAAYLTDVLEEEPMLPDHPLLKFDNVLITPHIGSRTYESVQRQGLMAVDNLLKGMGIELEH